MTIIARVGHKVGDNIGKVLCVVALILGWGLWTHGTLGLGMKMPSISWPSWLSWSKPALASPSVKDDDVAIQQKYAAERTQRSLKELLGLYDTLSTRFKGRESDVETKIKDDPSNTERWKGLQVLLSGNVPGQKDLIENARKVASMDLEKEHLCHAIPGATLVAELNRLVVVLEWGWEHLGKPECPGLEEFFKGLAPKTPSSRPSTQPTTSPTTTV